MKSYNIGKKVKLSCDARNAMSNSVKWYHNNKIVKSSPHMWFRKKKLLIKAFTRNDIGNYTCVTKDSMNCLGSINTTYILNIKMTSRVRYLSTVPPAATNKRTISKTYQYPVVEIRLEKGDNFTLDCTATKNFNVQYLLWYKVGIKQPIIDMVYIKGNIKQLQLFNITHKVQYMCMGFNVANRENPIPLLKVTVKFLSGTVVAPTEELSEKHPKLLLMIGVPVFAGVLSIIIIVFCFRYHRKVSNFLLSQFKKNLVNSELVSKSSF